MGGEAEWPEASPAGPGERVEELPPETVEALTTALNALRESIADVRFCDDLPGSAEARQAQAALLAQMENYVVPRIRTSTAPALIVVAGSTGAGKSTLVNSLAEKNVSRTGVRRPTTGTPVLVCHPEDHKWFAEGELLGGLERLDKPTPEAGLDSVVIAPTEKLPQGVALLDTPDIDSVVEEHHEIARRMLDTADLWIFVTTAARYADAPAWNVLRLAKERGARLAIVLSRVPDKSADVVLKHFVRMLTEYGLGDIERFVIHESKVSDGRLPDSEVTELRLWLAELSVDEARRAAAVRETLNGVLNSFRTRVPALAKHLEAGGRDQGGAARRRRGGVPERVERHRQGVQERLAAARRGAGPLAGLRGFRRPDARAAPAQARQGGQAGAGAGAGIQGGDQVGARVGDRRRGQPRLEGGGGALAAPLGVGGPSSGRTSTGRRTTSYATPVVRSRPGRTTSASSYARRVWPSARCRRSSRSTPSRSP
ncbi:GTPase [Nonomuraea salmonea]|uniref:GTPase n=1 Tax=Nonomuraea salmonea TaxID=46181 RepID=UPI002FE76D11